MRIHTSVDFVWVADTTMARRCRRLLAQTGVQIGKRVGTTPELISVLRDAYRLVAASDWVRHRDACLADAAGAFWSASYQRDPGGVSAAVESAWRAIRVNVAPGAPWPTHEDPRLAQRLADLGRLNDIPVAHWPEDLGVIAQVLRSQKPPYNDVALYRPEPHPPASLWDDLLIQKHPGSEASSLMKWDGPTGQTKPTKLQFIASRLGRSHEAWALPDDDTFQCVSVRDSLEAVEVAMGAIQSHMQSKPELSPADFGIMIPQGYVHAARLKAVATRVGLPLSNVPLVKTERDIGAEWVRFALMALFGAPPSMALRALLSNPLMPWSPDEGRYMANTLLDYGFSIKRPRGLAGTHEAILKAFETSHAVDHIPEILTSLVQTLRDEDGTERHRHRAVELVEQVCAAIRSGTRDLKELLKRIPVMPIATERERDVTQEGVTVYVEDEMPLRPVRYLFVLDFNDGHFPRVPTLSPVFSVDDWRRLRDGGLPLTLPAETAEWSRANFRRQLSHVSDQLVVLIPRFSPVGDRLHPSVSLMDFMCLSGGKEDPDEIVLDLDRPDDRRQLTWLAIAESAPATMPRELSVGDLSLKRNLLADSRASLEKPRTLSPSRLEGLLVSPLAWLLESMDALPRQWEPDRFDALTSGSIAHGVFEVLFPAGTTGVSSAEIDDRIADVFDAAIRKVAPALVAAEWAIERDNLLGTVRKAAMRWAQMLEELGAEVVQAEMKLAGHMDGLALSGAADAVIRLPNGALAVVDYKTASAKKYLQQMESGWDLQTALYSRMLENGGPKDPELRALLTGLDARSVTYYTLRDMAACANYQPSTGIRGWRFAGVDTSGQAMSALGERFRELRAGQVLMPRASVLKTLEKAGIGDYALRASPMTAVTMDDTGSAA